jgi:hypothetical protein
MKITDNHLKELGFQRNDISEEESGGDPYTYWTLDLDSGNPNFSLISCASDERDEEGNWYVEFFDVDDYKFTEVEPLTEIINVLNKSKIKK